MKKSWKKHLIDISVFLIIIAASILVTNQLFRNMPSPVVSDYKVSVPDEIRLHNCSVFDTKISFCYNTPVHLSIKPESPIEADFYSLNIETGDKIRLYPETFTEIDFIEYCGDRYDPNIEMCIKTIDEGDYQVKFIVKLKFSKYFGKYGMFYYGIIFAMVIAGTFFFISSRRK